jgi:hypothetical protein
MRVARFMSSRNNEDSVWKDKGFLLALAIMAFLIVGAVGLMWLG